MKNIYDIYGKIHNNRKIISNYIYEVFEWV